MCTKPCRSSSLSRGTSKSLWRQAARAPRRKLLKAVEEFHTYITNNAGFIPNYGERYRHGERISTGFVESTVNQVVSKRMVKKQQMRWSQRGAHLLLADSHARVERRVGGDVPHSGIRASARTRRL